MKRTLIPIAILLLLATGCGKKPFSPNDVQWQLFQMEQRASLRGISVVSDDEVWVCGNQGFVAHSDDGGRTWHRLQLPAPDTADFRDIHASGDGIVYVLRVGSGQASAIFKTSDNGKNWTLQYQNPFKEGFFNGMAFWDENRGVAFGDPVNGKFTVIKTEDGGMHWEQIPPELVPPARQGEYAFAGSGTCIITWGKDRVAFGTGGSVARVFLSFDAGKTWKVQKTPIQAGTESAGIFSLAVKDNGVGLAIGGDYNLTQAMGQHWAKTSDEGKTWSIPSGSKTLPFQSCVVSLEHWQKGLWLSVGPAGIFYSDNDGNSWQRLANQGFHTCGVAKNGEWVWMAGAEGRVAKLRWIQ